MTRRWITVALLFTGMVVSYIDRGNLSIAAGSIMRDFGLSPSAMGMLMSAFFWTYALFQIPAGALVDRIGIRWIYAAAFLTWSLASAGIALSRGATDIFALRLLLGLAEAVGPIASLTFIRQNFEGREQGLPTAIYIAAQNLGPAIGSWVGTQLIEVHGWRFMFAATSLGALLWLPLWLWLAPDSKKPNLNPNLNNAEPARQGGASFSLRGASAPLSSKTAFPKVPLPGLLAMSGCVLFSSYFFYFVLTWIPTYLTSRGFSTTQMGGIFSIPFVVMAVVNIASGRLADRLTEQHGVFKVRVAFASAAYAAASLVLLLLVYKSNSSVLPLLIIAVTGVGIGNANYWSLAQHIPPAHMVGRSIGFLNTLSQVAGIGAPLITGLILGPEKNFTIGLAIAGICPLLAAACLFLAGPKALEATKAQMASAA